MPPFRVTDYTDADLAVLATWINSQPTAPQTVVTASTNPAKPHIALPVQWSGTGARFTMCSSCHENGAPFLRGRALLEGYVNVVVRNGLRGMPAFPTDVVSDEDLQALVAWLNEQSRSDR